MLQRSKNRVFDPNETVAADGASVEKSGQKKPRSPSDGVRVGAFVAPSIVGCAEGVFVG